MSRSLDDGESMIAERDGVIDGKIASHGSKVVLGQSQSHDGGRLLGKLLHESLIRSGHLRFQAPSVEDKAVAKMMIHMTVSRDEMGGSEAVAFDIFFQRLLFSLVVSAAVYNHTLLAAVGYHVAVFPDVVADKTFYIYHDLFIFLYTGGSPKEQVKFIGPP